MSTSSPAGTQVPTVAPGCPFDPTSPAVWQDPYPFYARLREREPVAWIEPPSRWNVLLRGGLTATRGFWLLTRHRDVVAWLTDRRLGHRVAGAGRTGEPAGPADALIDMIGRWVLFSDPPEHRRIRQPLTRAIGDVPLDELASRMAVLATARLDQAEPWDRLDVIQDYAAPLPMRVIAELMGVPRADQPRLVRWSQALYDALGIGATPAGLAEASRLVAEGQEYFRAHVAARRRKPGDDLIGRVVRFAEEGRITEDELLATCILLLFAGHDTTVDLVGTAMFTLVRRPDALARLTADPTLDDVAIRECLRFESPQQLAVRYALEDVTIEGRQVARGDVVCLALGAANHDPAVFRRPDVLDFDRVETGHVAFGRGIHYCPGSQLGTVLARTALRVLLDRLPAVRLAEAEWDDNAIMRGLRHLVIEAGRA